jgi:two-component system, LytTR family, sensor histidine kinase AlgZ
MVVGPGDSRRTPLVAPDHFAVPNLCTAPAIALLVLVGQLLVLVLLFAGGELTWVRLALLSLFVQWVVLLSAGALCATRALIARLPLVSGALLTFALVLLVTLIVGLGADRVVAGSVFGAAVDGGMLIRQQVIAGIITALALRYLHVQQQLRAQEQSELRSRIQALQSRIRPHFLFNSMNIIASLIETDPQTAESVVEDLSELFRASLNDAGHDVPLEEELDLCRRYARIESLRLGERLALDWQVDAVPAGVRIPLLTLQPLLENAIYHGIQPRPEGGTIVLRCWFDAGRVNVEISNPLPAEAPTGEAQGNRMALGNIRSRLAALYGNRADLMSGVHEGRYLTVLHFPVADAQASADSAAPGADGRML